MIKIRPYLGAVRRVLKYKLLHISIDELMHIHGITPNINVDYKIIQNSRQESTEKMVRTSIDNFPDGIKLDFYIWTGDKSEQAEIYRKALGKKIIFAYSTEDKFNHVIPIPDFIYVGWKEAGIDSWESVVDECRLRGMDKYDDGRLFWIGNTKTHFTREKLIDLSKQNQDMLLCEGMTWLDSRVGSKQATTKYVSLPDHAQYKYLIDVQGNGYSGRLKLLFYLQRPIFISERRHREFFFGQLHDMENCVIVKENFEDLLEKLTEIEKKPELYEKIVLGQNQLIETVINKKAALDYLAQAIMNYGTKKNY